VVVWLFGCLAHDIGQAPFGHKGESTLPLLTKQQTGVKFEANKQNVRLLVGSPARKPLEVTCTLVDDIMKYKDKSEFPDKGGGFYPSEKSIVEDIVKETGTGNESRHPACYLMEAADDIAYLAGDTEDALKMEVLKPDHLALDAII